MHEMSPPETWKVEMLQILGELEEEQSARRRTVAQKHGVAPDPEDLEEQG